MRNRYLVLGLGTAALVAATVVAIGALGGNGAAGQTGAGGSTPGQQALPSGHPTVSAGRVASAAATADSSVKRTISQLQKAVKDKPGDEQVLLKLGDAYFLAQRYALAEKTFRDALRLKPGDATATVRLAMVWHAAGDTPRAVQAIKAVLHGQPDNQEAHYSMAIVYFSLERVQAARDEWAKAASIDPTSTIGRRSQNFVDLIDGNQSDQPSQGQGD